MMSSETSAPPKPSSWYYEISSLNKLEKILRIPNGELLEVADKRDFLYKPFIKTKKGKKPREIACPTDRIKLIQRRIVDRIFSRYHFPNYIFGGIKGKNPLEHPALHVGKKVVVTVDIKDCFPSMTEQQVYLLYRSRLNCSEDVSQRLTLLTTFRTALPLGAPTSNFLANLALLPCVQRIKEISEPHAMKPGQYVDDQAISGDELPSDLIGKIVDEFRKKGFKVSRQKIKIMRSGSSQNVINNIVNRKLSIPIIERKKVRAAVNQLLKMNPKDPAFLKQFRSVRGRVFNIKKLHPREADTYLKQIAATG